MESDYSDAVERAESEGLITIYEDDSLGCHDCGYTDADAFAVGPCPHCGSSKTRAVAPASV
jgi:rubrerythrin